MSLTTVHDDLYRQALESLDSSAVTTTPPTVAPSIVLRRVKIAAISLVAWPVLEILSTLAGWIVGML